MTTREAADGPLGWEVMTIKRPGLTRDLPAGREELMWVANSSTLISGARDVDMADAATRFQIQQTVLQSSLAVAARIMQTNLLNFL